RRQAERRDSPPDQLMTRRLKLGGAGALVLQLVLAATWTVRRLDGEDRAVAVTGTIEALQVDVSAKITARIVERTVAESQPVERGQLLVRLADAEPAAEVRRAEAAVRTAPAQLSDLAAGARSQEVEQPHSALGVARAGLADPRRVSPLNGPVLRKAMEVGETATPGAPIRTLMDPNDLWLRAYVSETDLGRIRLGQAATLSVDAFPGRRF